MSATLQEFTRGELLKLVTQKWIGRVIIGFEVAIRSSFETDFLIRPVRTRAEIERRFRILIKWFVTLRREMGWTVPHILDELPKILRMELDGESYEPNEDRSAWLGAGGPQELEPTGIDLSDPTPIINGIETEDL
jgi:hypothetical protein